MFCTQHPSWLHPAPDFIQLLVNTFYKKRAIVIQIWIKMQFIVNVNHGWNIYSIIISLAMLTTVLIWDCESQRRRAHYQFRSMNWYHSSTFDLQSMEHTPHGIESLFHFKITSSWRGAMKSWLEEGGIFNILFNWMDRFGKHEQIPRHLLGNWFRGWFPRKW